jgi:hypothetical protein
MKTHASSHATRVSLFWSLPVIHDEHRAHVQGLAPNV